PQAPGRVVPEFVNSLSVARVRVGQTTVMAADGCSAETASFQGFTLSVSVPSEKESNRVFAGLSDGGEVKMPLTKTFWSPRFGMVQDRFGVGCMSRVALPEQQRARQFETHYHSKTDSNLINQ